MTFRLVDLSEIFRFLAVKTKGQANDNERAKAWYKQLKLMASRAQQRRQLLTLSDEQLDDIGITRAQVLEEVNKPFWKA
jgi:uncharacterized protein YjiS (DUF1127 family)